MSAKEYLQQVKKIDAVIENLTSEIKSLYELATRTTTAFDDTGGGHGGGASDKLGECIAVIVDRQNELTQEVKHLSDVKKEILEKVNALDPAFAKLLYKRYFLYQTWESIAADMNYTYDGICKMHGRALLALERKSVYTSI